jgi:hypothetical protein
MWPNKDKPGYPENSEKAGWHFMNINRPGDGAPRPFYWCGESWSGNGARPRSPDEINDDGFIYRGPCYSKKDMIDACKKQRITTAQDMVDILDVSINNFSLKLEAMNTMSETFKMAIDRIKDGDDEQE